MKILSWDTKSLIMSELYEYIFGEAEVSILNRFRNSFTLELAN